MTPWIEGVVAPSASSALRGLLLDFPILIDTAIKGAVLLACCQLALRWLRCRSAAVRYLLMATAAIGHLVLPIVTWNMPPLHWEFLPPPPWVVASARIAHSSVGHSTMGASAGLVAAVLVWMTGAVVLSLRVVAAHRWTAARVRRSELVSIPRLRDALAAVQGRAEVTCRIELRMSDLPVAPLVCGLMRPIILLPRQATGWPDAMLETVLVHELAHVRRFDRWTQFAVQCVLIVFWFDPLLWVAARYMRVQREFACDDAVLRSGIDAYSYASHLITLTRWLRDIGSVARVDLYTPVAQVGATETEWRIRALLDSSIDRRAPGNGFRVATLVAVALLELSVGALRPFRWPAIEHAPVASIVAGRGQIPQ